MYKQNVYDSSKPTVYNVGTGKYMNEISVHDKNGNIDIKLVDKLKENRKIAFDDYLGFFDGSRRGLATQVRQNFLSNKVTKNLIEYYGYSNSEFDVDHWTQNYDPRVVGYGGIRGAYDNFVQWAHNNLPFQFIWFCIGCFWATIGCALVLTVKIDQNWFTMSLALIGAGCLGVSAKWFIIALLPQ